MCSLIKKYYLCNFFSQMLQYGCTRLEIGVQSVYEDIARDTNRGHTVKAVCESFQLSKDSGFKVVAHMMPDLPNCSMERDLNGFMVIFVSAPKFWDIVLESYVIHDIWDTSVSPVFLFLSQWLRNRAGKFNWTTYKGSLITRWLLVTKNISPCYAFSDKIVYRKFSIPQKSVLPSIALSVVISTLLHALPPAKFILSVFSQATLSTWTFFNRNCLKIHLLDQMAWRYILL